MSTPSASPRSHVSSRSPTESPLSLPAEKDGNDEKLQSAVLTPRADQDELNKATSVVSEKKGEAPLVKDAPAKRKRGRPRGSKKKVTDKQDNVAQSTGTGRPTKRRPLKLTKVDESDAEAPVEPSDQSEVSLSDPVAEKTTRRRQKKQKRVRREIDVDKTCENYVEYLQKLPEDLFKGLDNKYLSSFGFDGIEAYDTLVSAMDRDKKKGGKGSCDDAISWDKKRQQNSLHEIARIFEECVRRGVRPSGVASMRTTGKVGSKEFKNGDIEDRVYVGPYFAMFSKEPCLQKYFDPNNKSPFALPTDLKVFNDPEDLLDNE